MLVDLHLRATNALFEDAQFFIRGVEDRGVDEEGIMLVRSLRAAVAGSRTAGATRKVLGNVLPGPVWEVLDTLAYYEHLFWAKFDFTQIAWAGWPAFAMMSMFRRELRDVIWEHMAAAPGRELDNMGRVLARWDALEADHSM